VHFFLAFVSLSVLAQDKLTLKNGEVLEVKVIEVGSEEVSYKMFNNQDGPLFKQRHSKIMQIAFENGSMWSPDGSSGEEKPTAIQRFDEYREKNKRLQLIDDSTMHHVVMFHLGAPELDIAFTTSLRFHGGFSYEWQNVGNRLGVRVMPMYTLEIGNLRQVPENAGAITVAISPRYYLKNWRSSQFYLGLEFSIGGHIPAPGKKKVYDQQYGTYDNKWSSVQTGGHLVFGGQVTSKSKFNMNVEIGAGYKLQSYKYSSEMPEQLYFRDSSSGSSILFNTFARFGLGGRIRSAKN